MAIAAQRFNSLDKQYNVAMSSIKQTDPAQILNSASNSINSGSSGLLGELASAAATLNPNAIFNKIASAKNGLESALGLTKFLGSIANAERALRTALGLSKTLINAEQLASKNIDKILSNLFKNDPVAQGFLRVAAGANITKHLGTVTTGKPYMPLITLPTQSTNPPGRKRPVTIGNQTTDYQNTLDLMNRMTRGNFPQTLSDTNVVLRQTVTAATLAYDGNLTGVMQALNNVQGMTPEIMARASAIVLTDQASRGNAAAVMDVAGSATGVIGTTSAPIHVSPAILTDTLSKFVTPPGVTEDAATDLAAALFDALATIDPKWNLSSIDGIVSIKYVDSISDDLRVTLQAKATDNFFDEGTMEITFDQPDDLMVAAMIANDPNGIAQLRYLASINQCKC